MAEKIINNIHVISKKEVADLRYKAFLMSFFPAITLTEEEKRDLRMARSYIDKCLAQT